MAQKNSVQINVINFDGDSELLDFFFDQIKSIANINKYNDVTTVTLLKSKLAGPALKFLTQNPRLLKSNDINLIEQEFKKFFSPPSKTVSLVELNNLTLLPSESIKNFAHRLNVLAEKVYSDIQDINAHNSLKFMKFVSAIPSNLRVKIQEEGITEYSIAVERAQILQDIMHNEKILCAYPSSHSDNSLNEQLKQISEKLNALNVHDKNNEQVKDKNTPEVSNKKYSPMYNKRNNFKTRYSFKRHSPNRLYKSNIVICQLCFKKGHNAQKCFKWKSKCNPKQRYFGRQKYYDNNNQEN